MYNNRVRFKDERIPITGTYRQDSYASTSCSLPAAWTNTQNTAFTGVSAGRFRAMTDVVVANYHKQVKEGKVFFNPLESVDITVALGTGTDFGEWRLKTLACAGPYQYYPAWRSMISSGNWTFGLKQSGYNLAASPLGVPFLMSSLISASDVESAVIEASTKVAACRGKSSTNLWETLAEAEKASGLLANALTNAGVFLGKKSRTLKRGESMASTYLSYRYGLTPLIKDVEGALHGLTQAVGKVRNTCRGRVDLSKSVTTNTPVLSWYGTWNYTASILSSESVEVRAMSLDELVVTFGHNLGFSAKGLISLPWELLPYSFVVDWVLNIGDLISAIIPAMDLNQLGSCVVVKRTRNERYTGTGFVLTDPATYLAMRNPSTLTSERSEVITTRTSGLAMPGLVVKSDFRLSNLTRAGDAIALLLQQLNRRL